MAKKKKITKSYKLHQAQSCELLVTKIKTLVRVIVRQGKTNDTLEEELRIDNAVDEQLFDELLQNGNAAREDENQEALFRIHRIIDGVLSR